MRMLKLGFLFATVAAAAGAAAATNEVRTLNTPRTFPAIASRADWEARARQIREQVLVSCGLWPMPEKTLLQPRIFGRIERDGYSVEKVAIQTWPGFYLGGNLYRPLGQGRGPFPGILNPHGHWKEGRLADVKDGSVPGRCINFAKQGMVAFSYDMVGYNDTSFANYPGDRELGGDLYRRHRFFATNAVCQLWGISLMGLQTWNSIRALDFLESLPDVDKKRLACTGASGGGTQTFMLGAIDDRLAAQAPCVMVSHTMQGGCSCENAPGLRVQYSNMELAAAAAPRPQLLVAATGDWTKDTPTVEGPAVESIYRLFNTTDRLRHVRFDFGHNYNQTSREAVYAWFGRWLRGQPDAPSLAESPYQKEPDADLRVWPDGKLPTDALTDTQLMDAFKAHKRAQLAALQPRRKKDFEKFRQVMLPLWRHTLQIEWPQTSVRVAFKPLRTAEGCTALEFELRREGEPDGVAAVHFQPAKPRASSGAPAKVVVLANADGATAYWDTEQNPRGLAASLLKQGMGVVVITKFATAPAADPLANFYTTYNRTLSQHRVGDLLAVCKHAREFGASKAGPARVTLCGEGRAGLWALLAAPGADAVIADCGILGDQDDQTWLAPDVFCPGFRSLGGLETASLLAAPHPLLMHNTAGTLAETIREGYRAAGALRRLRVETSPLDEDGLVQYLRRL